MSCTHTRIVTPEGRYTEWKCLDCPARGDVRPDGTLVERLVFNPIVGWIRPGEDVITWHHRGVPCGEKPPPRWPIYSSIGTPADTLSFCRACAVSPPQSTSLV
jgi:hypothetical protein